MAHYRLERENGKVVRGACPREAYFAEQIARLAAHPELFLPEAQYNVEVFNNALETRDRQETEHLTWWNWREETRADWPEPADFGESMVWQHDIWDREARNRQLEWHRRTNVLLYPDTFVTYCMGGKLATPDPASCSLTNP